MFLKPMMPPLSPSIAENRGDASRMSRLQTVLKQAPAHPAAPHDADAPSDLERYGGYSGNNYYQRQMLALHAASAKRGKNLFIRGAEY